MPSTTASASSQQSNNETATSQEFDGAKGIYQQECRLFASFLLATLGVVDGDCPGETAEGQCLAPASGGETRECFLVQSELERPRPHDDDA
jgi:hypothetical protein